MKAQMKTTYKDLFIKKDNEYIFGIVFDENKDNNDATWILGKLFMKKYSLVYDLDKKIIGTYIGNKKEEEESKNPINLTLLILLIALGILVISLIIFIIFYLKKPRKIRAAELNDDNYEYFPNE